METPSLEQAYREQRLPLLRLAFLVSGSREDAEDIVQAVFTAAHARWDRIEDPGAYLHRAVVNRAKEHHRTRLRHLRLRPPPDPLVTRDPEIDETWQLIRRLSGTQRAVVVLHFYEDLPLAEIAQLLGRPAATVRSDLRRALAKLKKELS